MKKKMTGIWNFLKGKKAYLVTLIMVVYALSSVYLHQMTWQQAAIYLFGAGGLFSVRQALSEIQKEL